MINDDEIETCPDCGTVHSVYDEHEPNNCVPVLRARLAAAEAERDRAAFAAHASGADLLRIGALCGMTDDEYPLKAVERMVAEAERDTATNDRDHYRGVFEEVCAHVAEACVTLGCDVDRMPPDSWTLRDLTARVVLDRDAAVERAERAERERDAFVSHVAVALGAYTESDHAIEPFAIDEIVLVGEKLRSDLDEARALLREVYEAQTAACIGGGDRLPCGSCLWCRARAALFGGG